MIAAPYYMVKYPRLKSRAYVDFDHGSSASTEYRYFGLLLTCWYMGYFLTDTWFLVTSFRVLLHGYFYVHLFQEEDPVAVLL